MTKLYEMTLKVSIKVEADNISEARREASMIARQFIGRCGPLATGITIAKPGNSTINLI